MEQAVNTFQKGLRLDTHPMVQSNDSLSNALNGTFVTMNGNEVILQNDMGNRRIDEAYLPPGYVPVGMKEYGGVIYVAAHNPLTHTDQIGSFPSPERNIGQEYPDLSTDIRNKFQDYFISHDNKVTVEINDNNQNPDIERDIYLTNIESTLLPLTKERVLHAGDKFSIYFIDGDDTVPSSFKPEYISNYDNVTDNDDGSYTIIFPDKQYTLYAGVLNSSNEFVDITPSLARWEDGDIITDIDDKPEEYKFNRGYFIPTKDTKEESVVNTADDNNYLINRLTKAVNTYAYKLVGPLYLKIGLNTPETFDYEIKGEKGDNETYSVYITGVFTYNCPQPTFEFFSEHRRYDNSYNITITPIKDEINNVNILTYKRKCNLYLSSESSRSDYENYKEHYKYQIGVPTFNNSQQRTADKDTDSPQPSIEKYRDYYLQKFWYEGELNLNLFGTGLIDLQGWRFYNDWDEESDDADCYISCNFITYPKVDEEFSDLYIHFSTNWISGGDISENEWIKVSSIVGKIGSFRSTWKQLKLNPQQLYWVTFRYKSKIDNTEEWKYLRNKAFFLTTNLFNPCYIAGTEDYLDNFNKFSEVLWSGNYSTNEARNAQETEIVDRYRKVIIYPQFNSNVGVSSNIDATDAKLIKTYNSNQDSDFPVTITTNYTLNCKINDDGLTYNKIKYPKNLITDESILDNPGVTPKYYIKHTGYTIGLDGNKDVIVNTVSRGGKDFTNDQSFTGENSYENSDNNNPRDSFSISLNEYLNSGVDTEFTIHNVFTTIGKAIEDQEDDEYYKNIGFLLSFHPVDGGQDDYKKINLLCLNNKQDTNSEQGGTYLNIVDHHKVNINCDMRSSSNNHYLDHDIKLNEQYRIEIDSTRNDTNGYVHDYSHDDLDELSEKSILGKQNFSYLFIDATGDDNNTLGNDSENYQRFTIKKSPVKTDGINNKDNTLLFWKGVDQTWYIYPRLLPYANSPYEDNKYSSLISKLGNLANLYYSYETSKTIRQDDKIEKHSLNNYIYTLPYSVNLDVEFDVKYTNNNINYINNSINLNYGNFGIFTKNVQNLKDPIVTPIELKANTLQNFIPSILSEVYSNLVLEDGNLFGTFLDGDGKLLDEWEIYYKKGNKLYLTPNNDTFIVVPSQDEDYRLLSPKYPRSGSFEYNYLITGQGIENDVDSNHTVRLSLRSGVYLSNEFQTYEDITRQNSNTESSNTTATGTQNSSTGIIPNSGGRTGSGGVLIDPGQPANYEDSSRHLDPNENYYYS